MSSGELFNRLLTDGDPILITFTCSHPDIRNIVKNTCQCVLIVIDGTRLIM